MESFLNCMNIESPTINAISVVIPTLNRQDCIQNTVRDLLGQDFSNFEIVIVDQSPHQDTGLLSWLESRGGGKVSYFHVDFRGLPLARNFGWQKCSHSIIVFVDDDVEIPKNFLTEFSKSFKEKDVGLVAGGIEEVHRRDNPNPTRTGHFNFWTATPFRDFNAGKEKFIFSAPGGNFAVKKEVFQKISGFDEALSAGAALYEESEFCLRALSRGFKIFFSPSARLRHLAHETGGCRVPEMPKYIWSLARNRMFLITRYLEWYHMPTAMLRVFLLILSYTRASLSLETFTSGIRGLGEGFELAKLPPQFTPAKNLKIIYEKKF